VVEPRKAVELLARLRQEFEVVRLRVAKERPVSAVVVVGNSGLTLAGPDTFLDDLLTAAGGANAAKPLGNPWPAVDREKYAELAPEVVIHLLPDATPQALEGAKRFWASLPEVPAVRDRRVHILTDSYVLLPGADVGKLAERFGLVLHPFANLTPTTGASPGSGPASTSKGDSPGRFDGLINERGGGGAGR
jgi:iron complex transport system substrate-binding protein